MLIKCGLKCVIVRLCVIVLCKFLESVISYVSSNASNYRQSEYVSKSVMPCDCG